MGAGDLHQLEVVAQRRAPPAFSMMRPMVIGFGLSGGLAGLAGILLSIRSGSATPLGYQSLLLKSVTACLIGGIALRGGRGSIAGIAVGLFTLRFLVAGAAGLGAPFWMQGLATGALLILVMVVEMVLFGEQSLLHLLVGNRRLRHRSRRSAAKETSFGIRMDEDGKKGIETDLNPVLGTR